MPTKTVSFKISAGDQYVVNLDMSAGSRLEFRFTSDLDINFQLLGPLRGPPPYLRRRRRAQASDSKLCSLSCFQVGKTQPAVQLTFSSFSRNSRLVGKMMTRSLKLQGL